MLIGADWESKAVSEVHHQRREIELAARGSNRPIVEVAKLGKDIDTNVDGKCYCCCFCHWTRHMWFPIGGPLEPSVYLALLRRYSASKIMGSRVWPFGVTWRHRSRDHSTRHMWFPTGGPLEPCVYLAPLWRYKASKLPTHYTTSMRLPWRLKAICKWKFYTLACFSRSKRWLCMPRVTWPVGRGSKITTYLDFPRPCLLYTSDAADE